MNIVKNLEQKIEGFKFKEEDIETIQLTDEIKACSKIFSYNGEDIAICIGFENEDPFVSIPQDLKVNYNFKVDDIDGIKESIERCLKNGWTGICN